MKGAARAVNQTDIESLCQPIESVFAAWKRREKTPSPEAFDTVHRALDLLGQMVAAAADGQAAVNQQQISESVQLLHDLIESGTPSVSKVEPQAPAAAVPDEKAGAGEPEIESRPPAEKPPKVEEPAARPTVPAPAALVETVRISTAKLDALLLEAEEMLSVKLTAGQRIADLRQVKTVFEQWKKEWAKAYPEVRELRKKETDARRNETMTASQSPLLDFLDWNLTSIKSLESRFDALARSAEQDRHAAGKMVDDLLVDSKKLLMLPFSTVLGLFPKLIRDLSRDQGKEVELVMRGGEVEMDKRILEEMKDPLIHILRNCVDHGIEKPEQRARLNKPARATITVIISQVDGNKVEILVADDGAGISVAKVKEAAVRHRRITEEAARTLTDPEALALIFQSDVSTSPIITELSGRGLGLAIVREKAEKLGGRALVETDPPRGTTFRILLPLTLATFRGILVETGGQVFVIPTANVERVERIKPEDIKTVENRETISLNGRAVAFARLEEVLELPGQQKPERGAPFLPAVVLGAAGQRIAFGVAAVLNEEEVLVKRLGKPLSRVRNIAGATVLGSGKAVPILNAADLLKSAMKLSATARRAVTADNEPAHTKTILVVEDSITSRMLLKSILESSGYEVRTAVDGLDAWATLHSEDFDLVVSDVEMPRLNGFDLTARIRSDPKLAGKPVVLVTALSTREDRERGIDVGANAYIVKSSFDQGNLLEAIRRLT